jgi:hypothetical protein
MLTFKRIFWTLFLAGFAFYQLGAVFNQRVSKPNVFSERFEHSFWMAKWKMFTHPKSAHIRYEFEHLENGEWKHTPMETYFPFEWCHGHRWQRGTARHSWRFQATFLAAACEKTEADATRLVRHSWAMSPGKMEQPRRRKVRRRVLRTWPCGRRPPQAKGRVL